VPLTPIHIGDGTEWRPDEYFVEEPAAPARRYDEFGEEIEESRPTEPRMLCRFDQQAAMRAMTPVQRNQFATALDRGDLSGAAELLRLAGRAHVLDGMRLRLSQASANDLSLAMENPLRREGAVKPFIRSGGAPFIPGSSIKGAFRTALASAALPRGQREASEWDHASAIAAAFGLDPHRTETDPLRFLFVSDARLPDDATVIDKTEVIKSGGRRREPPIQEHYERTKALAIENEDLEIRVSLALDARAARPEGGIRRAEACFDLARLLKCLRSFHTQLFKEELTRFFEGPTKKLLTDWLRAHTGPNKEPPFSSQGYAPGFVLLRLGRFGHFESKSLEGVRRGHFPQARDRNQRIREPNAWGVTRTITRDAKDNPARREGAEGSQVTRTITRDAKDNPIPFGWVIGWVVQEETQPC
jgi:CRISPR-associated protein Csm5